MFSGWKNNEIKVDAFEDEKPVVPHQKGGFGFHYCKTPVVLEYIASFAKCRYLSLNFSVSSASKKKENNQFSGGVSFHFREIAPETSRVAEETSWWLV